MHANAMKAFAEKPLGVAQIGRVQFEHRTLCMTNGKESLTVFLCAALETRRVVSRTLPKEGCVKRVLEQHDASALLVPLATAGVLAAIYSVRSRDEERCIGIGRLLFAAAPLSYLASNRFRLPRQPGRSWMRAQRRTTTTKRVAYGVTPFGVPSSHKAINTRVSSCTVANRP